MNPRPLSFLLLLSLPACVAGAPTVTPAAAEAAVIARGEALVRLGGCGDCHTPMAFDPAQGRPVQRKDRWLSGHPEGGPVPTGAPGAGDQAVIGGSFTSFRLPFGVVYAANLTPDVKTGLGAWTEAQFIATLRTGHEKGSGRALLPPMPWQNLAGQSDEDLGAMFRYLRTIPAIANQVPAPEVPAAVLAQVSSANRADAAQAVRR